MQNKTKMPVHCICDWLLANEQQRFSVRGEKTSRHMSYALQYSLNMPRLPLSPLPSLARLVNA